MLRLQKQTSDLLTGTYFSEVKSRSVRYLTTTEGKVTSEIQVIRAIANVYTVNFETATLRTANSTFRLHDDVEAPFSHSTEIEYAWKRFADPAFKRYIQFDVAAVKALEIWATKMVHDIRHARALKQKAHEAKAAKVMSDTVQKLKEFKFADGALMTIYAPCDTEEHPKNQKGVAREVFELLLKGLKNGTLCTAKERAYANLKGRTLLNDIFKFGEDVKETTPTVDEKKHRVEEKTKVLLQKPSDKTLRKQARKYAAKEKLRAEEATIVQRVMQFIYEYVIDHDRHVHAAKKGEGKPPKPSATVEEVD